MKKHEQTKTCLVQPIEVLALTHAVVEGTNCVALVLRPDPTNSFATQTVVVTKDQAEQVRSDIQRLLDQPGTNRSEGVSPDAVTVCSDISYGGIQVF